MRHDCDVSNRILNERGSSKRPSSSASRDHGSKPEKGKSSVNIVHEDLVLIPFQRGAGVVSRKHR